MDDSLLSRAFEVDELTDDFDPTIPPSNGVEYLQHVMYEASKCPQTVVANIDRKKIKNYVTINLEPGNLGKSELAPSLEWQQEQVAIFGNLRKRVDSCKKFNRFKPVPLPKPHNEDKWRDLCIGDVGTRLEPSLSLLLSMNEALLVWVLEYHAEWLKEGLHQNQGKWIYALLACLGLPLTYVTCSAVREVARQCVRLRQLKNCKDDPEVIDLNLIICLVGRYFGQRDLADN